MYQPTIFCECLSIFLLIYQVICDKIVLFLQREVIIVISVPIDVLRRHPVRKSRSQKMLFRDDAKVYFEKLGYTVCVEDGLCGAKNLIIGNPNEAKYLITAHYDTPAWMPFPNLITPCHLFPFVLWQVFVILALLFIPTVVACVIAYCCNNMSVIYDIIVILLFVESLLLMFGPANKHNANDNTSGVVAVMEIAEVLPFSLRDKICFVLFDLEEAGLLGSVGYAKKHADVIKQQFVLNLDCVGDGDYITFFPTNRVYKSRRRMSQLSPWSGIWTGGKKILIREKGFMFYPSDQINFPFGIAIAALKKNKWGWLYCDKIHTHKDINFDFANIRVLGECIVGMIESNKLL